MKRAEAILALFRAKLALIDMGESVAAGVAEDQESRLRDGADVEALQQIAASLVKPGRRGRIFKVLYPRPYVRAVCFVAAVLRGVED